eukprot:TRINITY_DN1023_c2_g1_i1.p1 TRINITY_DN1023_c2_g1~~TRINITY_DN1023_c2_g1_i1.p1  ORF type:complete len:140 (-),score=44.36 TRINITY_DN1023_c2_g1_i1:243-662(-)
MGFSESLKKIYKQLPTVTWNEWGRVYALGALFCVVCGSIANIEYTNFAIAISTYGLIISVILFLFLWPVTQLKKVLIIFQNYWLAGAILFCCSIFLFFSPATLLGATNLVVASSFYFIGAFKHEKSLTIEDLVKVKVSS